MEGRRGSGKEKSSEIYFVTSDTESWIGELLSFSLVELFLVKRFDLSEEDAESQNFQR